MEDKEFLSELIDAKQMLLKYALYLTKDKESADELLQETVVHAYMRRDKFTAGTKLGR